MRLLNTRTFEFESFDGPQSAPDYAILSHVWFPNGEQSYHDVCDVVQLAQDEQQLEDAPALLSEKIKRCCAYALAEGYEYIWIDSCCIDKTSSAELSEAINSMYKWYSSASQCYAFLHDVDDDDDPHAPDSQFRKSVWFTRGWTLQELIAPPMLVFLTQNWTTIGTKHGMAPIVSQVTGVDIGILQGTDSLDTVSVARRMSWASARFTTREEDEAYSLMGLFGIHMPTIYGEGRHAFIRLQEEILKQFPDDTLFAWGDRFILRQPRDLDYLAFHTTMPPEHDGRLFAPSPESFQFAGDLRPISEASLTQRLGMEGAPLHRPPTYSLTRYGVQAELPILHSPVTKLGFMLCVDHLDRLVALILRPPTDFNCQPSPRHRRDMLHVGARAAATLTSQNLTSYRLVVLTASTLKEMAQTWELSISGAHIPQRGSLLNPCPPREGLSHPFPHRGKCSVLIPSWCKSALHKRGYTVQKMVVDQAENESPSHWIKWCCRRHMFVLSHPGGALSIMVGYCGYCGPIEAQRLPDTKVWSLRMQVRSCPGPCSPTMPPSPEALVFEPHPPTEHSLDHVQRWPRTEDGKAYMEYLMRGPDDTLQVMRLSVIFPASPRDLVLTLEIDFPERETSRWEVYGRRRKREG
ncbi:heterokaryon incompatibility protein-domain-containing protein [Cerioporus squamosus]|nr:heterokaryon incompatibility protein-domain-containing protein [Cerioporus squamosus]